MPLPVLPSAALLLVLLVLLHSSPTSPAPAAAAATSGEDETLTLAAGSTNVTLNCGSSGSVIRAAGVLWSWHKSRDDAGRIETLDDGSLFISELEESDQRLYSCQDAESNQSIHSVFIQVYTVPPAVTNLSVLPNSVFATVTWSAPGDGGSPIVAFRLSYRRDKSHLSPEQEERILSHEKKSSYEWSTVEVPPDDSSHTVYGLAPNSTYYFRLCAVNRLGCGNAVAVAADTKFDAGEVDAAAEAHEEERDEVAGGAAEGSSAMKIWAVGLGVVLVTFLVIGLGISLLLIRNCDLEAGGGVLGGVAAGVGRRAGRAGHVVGVGARRGRGGSGETTEEEAMELVPHITLNPSFNIDMLEYIEPTAASSAANSIANEDAIVDVVGRQQNDAQLIDTDDNELNLVNSPAHRPNG